MSPAVEKRTAPPELEHRAPLCTLCGEEVSDLGNDGWDCEHCNAFWPYNGWDGTWNDADAAQCGGVLQPFLKVGPERESIRTIEFRCLLDADHDCDHRGDLFVTWKRQT